MEPLFLQQTGWKHEWDQLRNRWNQLQHMYSWYKQHSKSTSVTLGPDGQINADPGWWADNTKGRSYCKRLQFAMPRFWPLMDQLFEKIVVDGSLSTTPTHGGQGSGGAPIHVDDNVGDGSGTNKDSLQTPHSCTSLGKRTSSSQDTATSPSRGCITKKATSGVAGVMQSFLDRLEIV